MSSESFKLKIKDIGRIVTGKTPSTKIKDNFSESNGYPFVTIPDMHDNRFITKTKRYVTDKGSNTQKSLLLPPGSILVSCIATVGLVSITKQASFTNQQINAIIPSNPLVDPMFLYYKLKTITAILNVEGDGGVTFSNVSKSKFENIELTFPPLSVQKEIAGVLSTIDSRIENLKSTNETLEKMAQALFKSWFVDFDPVKAKSRGEKPIGMSDEIAELFPSEFEETENGPIPKGWGLNLPLASIVDAQKGVSYKSADLFKDEGQTALVTLKSIKRYGGWRDDGFKAYSGKYKPTQKVFQGEIVMAFTDVTQEAELIGRTARVEKNSCYKNLVASLDLTVLRLKIEDCYKSWLYHTTKTNKFIEKMVALASGTTVLHLPSNALTEFSVSIPPVKLVKAFNTYDENCYNIQLKNKAEIEALSVIKNKLIEKLLG